MRLGIGFRRIRPRVHVAALASRNGRSAPELRCGGVARSAVRQSILRNGYMRTVDALPHADRDEREDADRREREDAYAAFGIPLMTIATLIVVNAVAAGFWMSLFISFVLALILSVAYRRWQKLDDARVDALRRLRSRWRRGR
jgi:hypothetical protein